MSSGAEASAAAAFLAGAFFAGAALAVAAVLPATAACVARVFALAAADVSVCAAVPPVAFWTLAFAASLAFAAPLAALTSFARPVTPGAVVAGVGAGAGAFGLSTVNHTAHTASMARRAMRKGGLIWLTAHRSDAGRGT